MNVRELLESAVRKLGPERAQQALKAFAPTHNHRDARGSGWDACALALAYGQRGELHTAILADAHGKPIEDNPQFSAAAQRLGLTLSEVRCVAYSFDEGCGSPSYANLKELLTAEAAKIDGSRRLAIHLGAPNE